MFRLRSWLTAVVAILAFVLVSCDSSTKVEAPTTYSAEQIQQIQLYIPNFVEAKERLEALNNEIKEQDWQEVNAIMRGPVGGTFRNMDYTASKLLPQDQAYAKAAARAVFEDMVSIDNAAADKDVFEAQSAFDATMRDFDQFLSLLPEEAFELPSDTIDEAADEETSAAEE